MTAIKLASRRGRLALAAAVLTILPLLAGAAAAQGGDVVVEDVRVAYGPVTYRIPRLEVRGTTQSQAEVAALFDVASSVPASERIARLSAREIVAPSVVSEFDGPGTRTVTTYRNVVLSSVVSGRVASAVADGGSSETTGGANSAGAKFERLTMSEVDLPLSAALASGAAGPPDAPLRRLYGAFALDGLSVAGPRGGTVRIARFAGRDFSARPTQEGWVGLSRLLGGTPDLNAASVERRRRVMDGLIDALKSFDLASLEATGIEFVGPAGDGDGSGRIAKVSYAGGGASEIRLEALEAGPPGRGVRVGSLSLSGYSLQPMLEVLRDAANPEQLTPSDLRRALPISGATRAADIEFEVAAGPNRPNARPPLRVALGAFDLAADKPVGGLPSDLRIGVRNLRFAIPPNPEAPGLQQVASLGYERVDLSLAAQLGWNEAGQEIVLRELSLEGAEMGSAVVRGVVGNVSKDVFDLDSAVASVALVGATAKSLDLAVENRGLAERILGRDARLKRRSVEDLRREYGMMAAIGIPATLGPSPAARTIGQAVARFIAKPGSLLIQARARSPNGFGFADFAAGPDPAPVLEQLEVTATAQ